MALEAMVSPHDPFTSCPNYYKEIFSFLGGPSLTHEDDFFGGFNQEQAHALFGALDSDAAASAPAPPSTAVEPRTGDHISEAPVTEPTPCRRKRRRTRILKNREEVENQRMTHIAVERNRRKQMNEYLAVLRSLMPPSYVQRGDQASIIGGAINYVKELEQTLQAHEAQRKSTQEPNSDPSSLPFTDFFTFPQYSAGTQSHSGGDSDESAATEDRRAGVADVEVTMVESHANVKIRAERRPRQLLSIVAGFQSLRLTTLHLNVTTVDQTALYSLSVKGEEGCQLTTVDDIAAAAHQVLRGEFMKKACVDDDGR